MRKLLLLTVLSALLLLGIFSPLSAQDDGEFYTFEASGITVFVPEDFEVLNDDDIIYFSDDTTFIFPGWYYPDDLEEEDIDAGDLAGVTELVIESYDNQDDFDEDNFEIIEVDGREIGQYEYEFIREDETAFEDVLLTVELQDGTIFYLDVYPVEGDELDQDGVEAAQIMVASATIEAADEDDPDEDDSGDTTTFDFDAGISVQIPEDWGTDADDFGFGYLTAENTGVTLGFYTENSLEEAGVDDVNSPEDMLIYYYTFLQPDGEFDEDDFEEIEVDGVEMLQYVYVLVPEEGDEYEAALIIVEVDDGSFATADVYPLEGDELDPDEFEIVQQVMASAELTD